PAVARAAMESGVATRPIADFYDYRQKLQQFVYHAGTFMQPVFAAARRIGQNTRIIFAEGEEERVLHAAQILVDEKLAKPILIGRRGVIDKRIQKFGLRLKRDEHFTNVDPENDPRYREYWEEYRRM